MTGEQVADIRKALGEAIGHRLSASEFGQMIGLAELSANRTIRRWEDEGPSGPGGFALRLIKACIDAGRVDLVVASTLKLPERRA